MDERRRVRRNAVDRPAVRVEDRGATPLPLPLLEPCAQGRTASRRQTLRNVVRLGGEPLPIESSGWADMTLVERERLAARPPLHEVDVRRRAGGEAGSRDVAQRLDQRDESRLLAEELAERLDGGL
jgi:hypothetical protein